MVSQTVVLKPELLPSPVLVLCLLFLPLCRPSVPCVDSRIHGLNTLNKSVAAEQTSMWSWFCWKNVFKNQVCSFSELFRQIFFSPA